MLFKKKKKNQATIWGKHSQHIYHTKDLYSEYVNNSNNAIIKQLIPLKNGQIIISHISQKSDKWPIST